MENSVATVVIYHGTGCLDGFGSAFAAYSHFGNCGSSVEYFPASHGSEPPPVDGKNVFILDFSYKRDVLSVICEKAHSVVILDHHESAEKELAGLENEHSNLSVIFDMSRSGAVITWEYFHESAVPPLLAHIQDRDLWHFRIPDSKHVNAALMSYPYEFDLWEQFAFSEDRLKTLKVEGRAINRFRDKMIAYYKNRAVRGVIAGYDVPIVNCSMFINSELLGELAIGEPFAASYSEKGAKRGWSLRSTVDGKNVADIAAEFGGGGHPRAAGFATTMTEPLFNVVSKKAGQT